MVDRTGWSAGPWDSEPDRLEWRAHGMPCLIARNELGALCGYVAVPPGHPLHGADLLALDGLRVHGGVTYVGPCARMICHVAETGEPDDVWWVGFDACHAFDAWPALLMSGPVEYRSIDYMREQTESLASQLAAVARGRAEDASTSSSSTSTLDAFLEREGYYPGHEPTCPLRGEPFELAPCSCGPTRP